MKNQQFTKDQWREEMFEAKANGCSVMTYEAWVEYRQLIADLFDDIKGKQ